MSRYNRSLTLAAVSLAAVIAASTSASAGGFALREQSATAQGLSFAGAASGSGALSSMFWNPATVTMRPGWNKEFHASAIFPEAEITPVAGTSPFLASPTTGGFIGSGDNALDALLVSGYNSYQINDKLYVGLATTAPFGLSTKTQNENWSGSPYHRSARVFSFDINPILGYRVNDWLSVGAGPTIQYFDIRTRRGIPVPPLTITGGPSAVLEGDSWGVGFTAGLTLTPFAGTQIGVGFRSSVHHDLEGSVETPFGTTAVDAKVNTPEQVTIGLTQAIGANLRVHAGFEWQNWSRLGTQAVRSSASGGLVTELPLNYDDGFMYSIGAEYDFSPALTFRAGLAYEESPIDEEVRSPRLPDNDRIWASIGATYRFNEKLSFDIAYTHIFVDDTRIDIGPGHQDYIPGLDFVADVDSNVNIISAALRYRWDDPKVAIPVAPLVRKN